MPLYDATVAARCKAAGLSLLGKTNTDEFAMGSSTENSRLRAVAQPVGSRARARAAPAAARRRPSPRGSRRGRSAPTPAARSSSPRRSAATSACARPTARVSRYGVVAFASSLDQVGPVAKTVRDCALLYSIIAGRDPMRLDHRRAARAGPPAGCRGPEGPADRRPARAERGRGDRARRRGGRPRARSSSPARSAPRWGSASCRTRSSTACPATT